MGRTLVIVAGAVTLVAAGLAPANAARLDATVSVRITASGDAFAGKVRSRTAACVKKRTVVLQRKAPGSSSFTKVGTDRTTGAGAWRVATTPVDMRKSFDGLHALVQSEFKRDVRLGDLFLFLNRRLDRIKLLQWDRDGMLIVYKRLESGTFQRPPCPSGADHVVMDATDLAVLLTGIELASVRRRRRYSFDSAAHDAILEPSRT